VTEGDIIQAESLARRLEDCKIDVIYSVNKEDIEVCIVDISKME
jgi:hypothetical protein